MRIYDLLTEIKLYVVSKHLIDDPDELAGTVPEGIVMRPAFRDLGVIVRFESGVILNHVVSSVHQSIAKDSGAPFRHPGTLRLEVSRLIDRRVKNSKGKQLR